MRADPEIMWSPMRPWDALTERWIWEILDDLHPMDAREIFALRPDNDPGMFMVELKTYAHAPQFLAGGIAFDGDVPVALAMAWRETPRLASLAFFGRPGFPRAMRAIRAELGAMRAHFGADHDLAAAGVKVLADYATARRWMRGLDGEEVADLGGIGRNGERFVQMIWRF